MLLATSTKICNRKKYDSSKETQLQNHEYDSSFIINISLQDKKKKLFSSKMQDLCLKKWGIPQFKNGKKYDW